MKVVESHWRTFTDIKSNNTLIVQISAFNYRSLFGSSHYQSKHMLNKFGFLFFSKNGRLLFFAFVYLCMPLHLIEKNKVSTFIKVQRIIYHLKIQKIMCYKVILRELTYILSKLLLRLQRGPTFLLCLKSNHFMGCKFF